MQKQITKRSSSKADGLPYPTETKSSSPTINARSSWTYKAGTPVDSDPLRKPDYYKSAFYLPLNLTSRHPLGPVKFCSLKNL